MLLFALGIFLRDKEAQNQVYRHLGPLYGYFETFWLISLLTTGTLMFHHFGIDTVLSYAPETDLAQAMHTKLWIVALITAFTVVHVIIAVKTHTKSRSRWQKIVSRSSSMMIFMLNLLILWFAITIRSNL